MAPCSLQTQIEQITNENRIKDTLRWERNWTTTRTSSQDSILVDSHYPGPIAHSSNYEL